MSFNDRLLVAILAFACTSAAPAPAPPARPFVIMRAAKGALLPGQHRPAAYIPDFGCLYVPAEDTRDGIGIICDIETVWMIP